MLIAAKLSEHVHPRPTADDAVTIQKGPSVREQMKALACVAKHLRIAYEMKYI